MASPVVQEGNQFSVLASPNDEGKVSGGRAGVSAGRFSKDDVKEQAFLAKEGLKQRALDLKEKVVASDIAGKISEGLATGIETIKEKAGYSKQASNEEVLDDMQEKANEQWETVKRKGNKQLNKAQRVVDQKLDENLTPEQRASLDRNLRKAKQGAVRLERKAEGWSNQLIITFLSGPRLRPLKNFILRNHLQLPAVMFGFFLTMWLGLSVIRMITHVMAPPVPEFDIHSKEATLNWLKYHAGDYKDKAVEMQESLAGRAAALLANYEWEKIKNSAVDWKDLGIRKLGMAEPTWGEWAWARLTGRPISWQERVTGVIERARAGISRPDLHTPGFVERVREFLSPHEPTMREKASAAFDSLRDNIPGMAREPEGLVDSMKSKLQDGFDTIRSHLPGSDSIEAARQRAYDATHPSTLDNLRSGANYLKNRVVHGAQEAAHNVQDRTNEVLDKARYKAGY